MVPNPEGSESAPPSRPLVAGLTREDLLELYRALVRTRALEERLELLFTQGHVTGGVYRSLGQEAGAVGVAYALRRRDDSTGDLVAQTIRATGAVLVMGGTPEDYLRQYLSRVTGPTRGKEANVHWCDFRRGLLGPVSPLGSMVEVTAGIAMAFRMKGEERVAAVFGGDGAASTGAWHEGVNFAAVQRAPMLLVIEANQWAFSTPTHKQTRLESFTEKCPGYGIRGVSVDGNDIVAVYEAAHDAAERARRGEGVQMLELRYYRRKGHAQHDPQEYVDPAELAEWEGRDPITRFRARLLQQSWAGEAELDSVQVAAREEVRAAAERALAEPGPDPVEALEGVWGDLELRAPWYRRERPGPNEPHLVPSETGGRHIDPYRAGDDG